MYTCMLLLINSFILFIYVPLNVVGMQSHVRIADVQQRVATSYKVVNMHEALGGGRFAPSQFFWKHFFPVNLQIGILKDSPPPTLCEHVKNF